MLGGQRWLPASFLHGQMLMKGTRLVARFQMDGLVGPVDNASCTDPS